MNGLTERFIARNGLRVSRLARIGGISICDRSRRFSARNSLLTLITPIWLSVVLADRDQSSWSLIPTKTLQARFLKVSTTKQSIFWTLRSLATAISAGSRQRSTARGYPGLSFRFFLIQNGSVSRASLFRRDSP